MDKTAIIGILALLVVLTMPIASAEHAVLHFKPADSTAPDGYGHTTIVEVWVDTSQCTSGTGVNSLDVGINYDPNCVEIVNVDYGPSGNWMMWTWNEWSSCHEPGLDWITTWRATDLTDDFRAFNLTFRCNNSCPCCKTNLDFSDGADPASCWLTIGNQSGLIVPPVLDNGTLTCGSVVAEPFSKPLYEGWNLISLPIVSEDNSASTVLSTVSYDAVYRYNATSKQFDSADVMDPGTGYFVHATEDCTWEYSGTAYTSMSTSLEQGLNMVGWLNCSKDVGDALSSISGDYYYAARWNAAAEKFEVYNPAAPSGFNDFATMDRGTGYFISAKQECALSENC